MTFRIYFLLILGYSFSSTIECTFSQNYFPLSIGNKYQIEHTHADEYFGIYYTNYSTEYFVDDSLVYNDEVYYKYNNEYLLYDSVQQKLFIYNQLYGKQLAADFNLQEGENFITFMQGSPDTAICNGTYIVNIFNQNRIEWEMQYELGDPPFVSLYIYDFVDGIGNFKFYQVTPGYDPSYRVYDTYTYSSAIINSQIYNPLYISLNLLTDLNDTQISDFPFSVNVILSMPHIELLDSLYLDYMVVRDSEIIWSDMVNFDRTYYYAIVNPPTSILSVGDEIRLRMVVTDNSIFANHVYLPDSGFYSIRVLPDQLSLKLYPLAVGNKWIYEGVFWDQAENYTYTYIRKVTDIVNKPNQLDYYEVEEYQAGSPAHNNYFERIDSLSGKVYRYDEDSVQSNNEYFIDNLNAVPGDTIMSYRFPTEFPYTLLNEGDTTIFQTLSHYKIYDSNNLVEYQYTLAHNFGLISVYNYFDFGSDIKLVKGAVVNNIVYGDTTITALNNDPTKILEFSLSQNFPNPFNPSTNIEYQIPNPGFVTLKVYDVLGNEVTTLVNEEKSAGSYNIEFNADKFSSGVYFYKLQSGNFLQVRKMLLLK